MPLVPSPLVNGPNVNALVPSAANTTGSGAALQVVPKRSQRVIRAELNSMDRNYANYPFPTEFRWQFPYPVKEVREIRIVGGTIPLPFLNIDNGWNQFTFQEGTTQYTVTIPIGFYTIASLLSVLTTLLNGLGASNTYVVNQVGNTGQIRFMRTAGTADFALLFATGNFVDTMDYKSKSILQLHSPARLLGFGWADYASVNGAIRAPRLPNLWFALERSYLYFNFDNSIDLRGVYRGGGRKEPSAIVYHDEFNIYNTNLIDPAVGPYPLTKYLNKETFDTVVQPGPAPLSRISYLEVSLRDMFFNLINTQGREMSLLLELVVVD